MMPGVLVHPPAEAQADQQVAHHQAEQVVPAAAGKHLPMSRVVAEKRDLSEGDTQNHCSDRLVPAVTDHDEQHPPGDIAGQRERNLRPVVAAATVQQTRLFDPPTDDGVVAAMHDGRGDDGGPSATSHQPRVASA